MEWGEGTPLPGRAVAAHPAGAARLLRVELSADRERVAAWLGTDSLPIAVSAGHAGVVAIVLASDAGEIVMRGPL